MKKRHNVFDLATKCAQKFPTPRHSRTSSKMKRNKKKMSSVVN